MAMKRVFSGAADLMQDETTGAILVFLEAADIQIGGVEIKDGTTDLRAKAVAGNAAAAGDNALVVADPNVKAALGAVADAAAEGDAASGSVIARLRGIAKAVGTTAAGLLFDIKAALAALVSATPTDTLAMNTITMTGASATLAALLATAGGAVHASVKEIVVVPDADIYAAISGAAVSGTNTLSALYPWPLLLKPTTDLRFIGTVGTKALLIQRG